MDTGAPDHGWSRKPEAERRSLSSSRLLWNTWEFRHPGKVFLAALAAVIAIGMLLAAVFTDLGDSDGAGGGRRMTAPVEIDGTPLPGHTLSITDPAVGAVAPDLSGVSFDGTPLAFTADDGPRAIVFLAHWCPHCQAEVDDLVSFMEASELPDGVDVQTVSTMASSQRPNYPPDAWLRTSGWPFPVMVDDGAASAANAFGLSGTPFWVFVDADGRVLQRASGQISPDALVPLLEELAASGQ